MKIIISPFAQILRDDPKKPNLKNYPHFQALIDLLIADGHTIRQLGRDPEQKFIGVHEYLWSRPLKEVEQALWDSDLFIGVDNFCHHMIHALKIQTNAVVLWSRSDPKIYGYEEQTNILKSPQYLRPQQFQLWEQCPYDPEAYVAVDTVYKTVSNILNNK